jgi:hypothetical protein
MKTLSANDIECLLGIRASQAHPLEILGYGSTSEGAQKFGAEQPDFLPQIEAYVRSGLEREGIFPMGTDPDNPGPATCIRGDGDLYTVSSMEDTGTGIQERFSSVPLSETEAVMEYIRRVANPDYIRCVQLVS